MDRKLVLSVLTAAAMVALSVSTAHAQKNYTDGGDLYGGAHAATTEKPSSSKDTKKPSAQRSGKFDPYTEGAQKGASSGAKKFPDERPQPDDVARSGKFDPYTEGKSK
ncbi:hypothetical protein [Cupriavidus pauculus]|uniref:hypothetical protein n=1 Tax=Cupriavidus pauculus TaxID=82633 RepID=UPI0009FE2234|nr:hypothetical protein [Cupriavidus pauculus]